MNKKVLFQIISFTIYFCLLAIFVYECLQTGEKTGTQIQNVGGAIADAGSQITGTTVENNAEFQKKVGKFVGHYMYFCLIGIASIVSYMTLTKIKDYYRIIIHIVTGFTFALITEFVLEARTNGRSPMFSDVLIDTAGLLTLSIIYIIIYYIIKIKKNKRVYNSADASMIEL